MNLPTIAFPDLSKLPKVPGIYYVVLGEKVLYIGKANNLYRRWNARGKYQHHQIARCREIWALSGAISLAYQVADRSDLETLERQRIIEFTPPWNAQVPGGKGKG